MLLFGVTLDDGSRVGVHRGTGAIVAFKGDGIAPLSTVGSVVEHDFGSGVVRFAGEMAGLSGHWLGIAMRGGAQRTVLMGSTEHDLASAAFADAAELSKSIPDTPVVALTEHSAQNAVERMTTAFHNVQISISEIRAMMAHFERANAAMMSGLTPLMGSVGRALRGEWAEDPRWARLTDASDDAASHIETGNPIVDDRLLRIGEGHITDALMIPLSVGMGDASKTQYEVRVTVRATGATAAMRVTRLKGRGDWFVRSLRSEMAVLSRVNHRHLLRLKNAVASPTHAVLLLPHCDGHSMLRRAEAMHWGLDQSIMKEVIRQLVSALTYLSAKGIVHQNVSVCLFSLCHLRIYVIDLSES